MKLLKITLTKSLLSCPVAATLKTDSAAPIVLAMHATMLLAVSWDICHSRGSTGTLQKSYQSKLKWYKHEVRYNSWKKI